MLDGGSLDAAVEIGMRKEGLLNEGQSLDCAHSSDVLLVGLAVGRLVEKEYKLLDKSFKEVVHVRLKEETTEDNEFERAARYAFAEGVRMVKGGELLSVASAVAFGMCKEGLLEEGQTIDDARPYDAMMVGRFVGELIERGKMPQVVEIAQEMERALKMSARDPFPDAATDEHEKWSDEQSPEDKDIVFRFLADVNGRKDEIAKMLTSEVGNLRREHPNRFYVATGLLEELCVVVLDKLVAPKQIRDKLTKAFKNWRTDA